MRIKWYYDLIWWLCEWKVMRRAGWCFVCDVAADAAAAVGRLSLYITQLSELVSTVGQMLFNSLERAWCAITLIYIATIRIPLCLSRKVVWNNPNFELVEWEWATLLICACYFVFIQLTPLRVWASKTINMLEKGAILSNTQAINPRLDLSTPAFHVKNSRIKFVKVSNQIIIAGRFYMQQRNIWQAINEERETASDIIIPCDGWGAICLRNWSAHDYTLS